MGTIGTDWLPITDSTDSIWTNALSFSVLGNAHVWLASNYLSVFIIAKVKDYDYYGAYDTKKNVDYKYNELLGKEYTFDFPPHHDVVRYQA